MPPADLSPSELADILAFYAEAGVDCALDEVAHVRFGEAARPAAPRSGGAFPADGQRPSGPVRSDNSAEALPARVLHRPAAPEAEPSRPSLAGAALSADEAAAGSARLARAAATLDDLREAMDRFEGCALKATAKNLCFADGNPSARLMLVGEAPGADEDRMGLPFVGVSGQLLDLMLSRIGLTRATDVYIANIVPWRPPGNRTPTTQEMMICRPFIERQIELAAPDILVTLGGPASQALLGVKGIMAERGRWRSYQAGSRTIPALPTLHPAYLLRNPIAKRQSWADLRSLAAALKALPQRA
jgi:uracil-DNA glycosylase